MEKRGASGIDVPLTQFVTSLSLHSPELPFLISKLVLQTPKVLADPGELGVHPGSGENALRKRRLGGRACVGMGRDDMFIFLNWLQSFAVDSLREREGEHDGC